MTDFWRYLLKYDMVRDRGDAPHIESQEGPELVHLDETTVRVCLHLRRGGVNGTRKGSRT
jgi:hypothetical protein